MAFCPFFSTQCPESNEGDEGCRIWNGFGCEMIEKAGKPATYTDGEEDPVNVFILQMFSEKASINDDVMIVYALASDGTIHLEDDITKFVMHML